VKVFFDTSTLVAALIKVHPAHAQALVHLQRVKAGIDAGLVAAHSLAELYAILTSFPIRPRISPETARRLIQHDVLDILEVVSLSDKDYVTLIDQLSAQGIAGGATYDALILQAAAQANADQVVTLNEKDFRRLRPDLTDRIVHP